ncbi:hypothetical protein [Streptomyces sp. NPDC097981]|uniref:hypothetical protein n=1 Tax=Streptomyces sp. NPDC097981 TaxID=3155428 RepID=UPI0033249C8F
MLGTEIAPGHKPPKGTLYCAYCLADVDAVSGYKNVAGYFRLVPGSEHEPACDLNPTEVINSIARGSHGLGHVDDGILRLELPQNLAGAADPAEPAGPGQDGAMRTRNTTTIAPLLPPAITSAAKIARFLQLHDFDSDIVKKFSIQPHGHGPVPWKQFCYGPDEASLAALYKLQASKKATHPLAIHATVQAVRKDAQDRPYVTLAVNVPTGQGRFHVVLRSAHEGLIKPLTPGTHVLALGNWSIFTGGYTPHLRLFADAHWQIAYWHDTEASGRPTSPACPPPVPARPDARAKPTATAPVGNQRVAAPPAAPQQPDAPKQPATPPPNHTAQVIREVLTPPAAPTPPPVYQAPAIPPRPTTPPATQPPSQAHEPADPAGLPDPPMPPETPTPVPPPRRRGLFGWLTQRR